MKTAHSLITFEVIDKIFENKAEFTLTSMSKMLYINALFAHFKNKEATEKNLIAFEIFYSDIKNFKKWEKNFQELHKARLVTIYDKCIIFNNVWGSYIDRSEINQVKNAQYESSLKDAEAFKQSLVNNQTMFEVTGMKHRISKENMLKMIDAFIAEQMVVKNKYLNESECTRHFIHWVGKNATNPIQSINKSQTKIIGRNDQ